MRKFGRFLVGCSPWLVIAGLLLAAIYLEPAAVEDAVQPAAVSDNDRFYDVAHANPDALWMVGNMGKIVYSADGGEAWVEQSTPVDRTLQSVVAWDHDTLVAVGDGGVVLRTSDGGTTWEQVAAPVSEIADKLIRVRRMDDGTAWITGEFGTVLVSRDRGRTWVDATADEEDVTWHDIAGNGEFLCVVGEFGRIKVSRDGGATWTEVESPVAGTLNSVAFRDADHGVAVGLQGAVVITSDGGATWEALSPIAEEHLYSVTWSGGAWMVAGDKGVVARAGASARDWETGRISNRDYGWHTGMAAVDGRWLLAGMSNGFFADGEWRRIGGRLGETNS
ncbi:YCF48-related protein [Algiphilus sp.]|uniref:WD40/YVTN/BNR-like repeat-containing protein n=1 Tax=Algiphilus sp. TaxID=1872431 RepID=UPI0032EDD89E